MVKYVLITALICCLPLALALTSYSRSSCTDFGTNLQVRHVRQPMTSSATSRANIEAISNEKTSSESQTIPIRYSSRDAAGMIKNSTAEDGLLIITTDASGRGGGSKHDGLAAVLRIRHGVCKMPHQNTSMSQDEKVDLLDTICRRRAPSKKDSNEAAAISLGMKRALQMVPPPWRKKVLVISDSESSLRFYCGDNRSTRDSGGSHRRVLARLMMESPDGVFFTKIRSSSRGIGMIGAGEGDGKSWNGIGFVDHDAADYLSSATRSKPNPKVEYKSDESLELEELTFEAVCPLRPEDIDWLENSDEVVEPASKLRKHGSTKQWNKITVRGSDARNEQRKRSERKQQMIVEMLGIGDV